MTSVCFNFFQKSRSQKNLFEKVISGELVTNFRASEVFICHFIFTYQTTNMYCLHHLFWYLLQATVMEHHGWERLYRPGRSPGKKKGHPSPWLPTNKGNGTIANSPMNTTQYICYKPLWSRFVNLWNLSVDLRVKDLCLVTDLIFYVQQFTFSTWRRGSSVGSFKE